MPKPQSQVRKELTTESVLRFGNVKVSCDHEGVMSQKPVVPELPRK